ncbi:PspC domain-containing protein [Proteiniclasticum sp. C24MP]|uniref:PspC domain-containing protein n=1 Tax=Proteiniclasticum sp. C24MP TaxID=3374101 RepID=UPI003754D530
MEKKLYKNTDRKMISGVLAGFSDYLGIDVTILRIGYVLLSLIMEAFPGIILYIILAIVMPDMDERDRERKTYKSQKSDNPYASEENAYGQKNYQDVDYKETKDTEDPDKNFKKSGGAYTPDDRH